MDFNAILKQQGVTPKATTGDFNSLMKTTNTPAPVQSRNFLQGAAGMLLDPVAKLAAEGGQALGVGLLKGADFLTGGAVGRATPEGNLKGALDRSTSQPTRVPGLGTPVKPLNQVTGKDIAGQTLGVAGLATGNPMLGGSLLAAGGALEDNQSPAGIVISGVGGALMGKVLDLGFKAVAPQIDKAIQKYGTPLFEKISSHIPDALKDTYRTMAGKADALLSKTGISKVQDVASNVDKKISGIVSSATTKVGDKLAGSEANYTAGKISNIETQAYLPKEQGGQGKTFSEVVDKVKKGINDFQNKSIKALNAVKAKITGTHFKQPDIAQVVNDKLTSVLGNRAETRGLTGFDMTNASVNSLKSYGLINDQEEKLIKGMIKTITNNPDIADRGILNLKEDLYKKYFKAGNQDYTTSNKIVMSIYDGFNELVGSANKALKPALDIASKNIQDGESMMKQLLGTGAEREAKLKSIATNLKNGAVNADDIKLIQQLEQATKTKILPSLEGYGNYTEMLAEKNKTGKFPTASGVKSKAILDKLKIAGLGGLGVTGYEELKHLGVPLP